MIFRELWSFSAVWSIPWPADPHPHSVPATNFLGCVPHRAIARAKHTKSGCATRGRGKRDDSRSEPVSKKRETRRYQERTVSGFDLAGGGVPGHGRAAEIRFVGHVARQRRVVAENGVFRHRLAVLHALEEFPEMRFFLVPGDAAIGKSFCDWFSAGLRIVLRMPLLEVSLTHGPRIADGVIARRLILARLREVGDGGFRDFQDSLGALETVNLRRFAAEI